MKVRSVGSPTPVKDGKEILICSPKKVQWKKQLRRAWFVDPNYDEEYLFH